MRVAVVDDDAVERSIAAHQLAEFGCEPFEFRGMYQSVEQLIDAIVDSDAEAVFCDNHLNRGGYANFFGAEIVSRMNSSGIPSILTTQYQGADEVSLRKWRPDIPVILDKGELSQEQFEASLEKCSREILHQETAADRTPHRVIVRVDEVIDDDLIVFVDAWDSRKALRLSLDQLPEGLRGAAIPEKFLIAHVNIGAEEVGDLFFKDIEIAPDPDDADGL